MKKKFQKKNFNIKEFNLLELEATFNSAKEKEDKINKIKNSINEIDLKTQFQFIVNLKLQ